MPRADPVLNQPKFPSTSSKFDLVKEKRKKLWSSKKEVCCNACYVCQCCISRCTMSNKLSAHCKHSH